MNKRSSEDRYRRPSLLLLAAILLTPAAASGNLPGLAGSDATTAAAKSEDSREADRIAAAIADLGESPVATVLEHLSHEARRFNDHVVTLANPFFEGRAPGTEGNRFAADYIEFYFRQFGLEPAFDGPGDSASGETDANRALYRQTFQAGRDVRIREQAVSLLLPAGRRDLTPGHDFTILGLSGSGAVKAPIVFAGYGIVDGPDGYSSFPADADFTGRVALILRFEPMDQDGRSRWAAQGWSPAAQLDAKIAAVIERNAAGIILVNPPGADDVRATSLIETRAASGRGSGRSTQPPVAMISDEAAGQLFQAAFPDGDITLLSARQHADEAGFPFELPDVEVQMSARVVREPVLTDNVGAVLPGRGGLADEYIVIGAHYDHVGYGPAGARPQNWGKLHPGADDNASGTAGVLILAEKLSEAYDALPPDTSARSILFLAFSAEELGLIGSRYFVNNPPAGFDVERIYLMLNLDMIGRLRERVGLAVEGVESGADLLDWLQPYFEASGLRITHGGRVSGNSDHASFYRRNIPVLFFFTGLHREYHTPQDFAWMINQAGAARVLDLAYEVAMGLAQRTETLDFVSRRARQAERSARPDEVDDPPAHTPAAPRMGGGVRFGIAPGNYNDDDPGIEVADVYEGTSAAQAGVKVGDRIVRWNEHPITTVESWMPLLMSHSPGDVVKVTVMREGQELTLDVTLQGRGGNN
jgi:hypothetical protein